jgi:Fe(3+) dicitrate transport protein
VPAAVTWLQQHGNLQGAVTRRAAALAAAMLASLLRGEARAEPLPSPPPPTTEPAAEPAASEEPATPGPTEVYVLGDKADALAKIPGSGTLVTSKEIQRAQPLDAGEMLRRVPGLAVRQEEGGGLRLDIGVRGLDATRSRRVLVLEDGIPVAINPYGEPDLYYGPPVERMRGIEIRKGSGSVLYGPQTIGGVINILTLLPPSRREASLEVQGGERGFLKLLSRYGDAVGGARFLAQIVHKRGDGVRDQAFSATDLLGKVTFATSERGEATLKLGIHDEDAASTDVGLTRSMFEADPERPTLAPHDDVHLRRYEASLIHEHAFSERTELRTLLYAYTTSRNWRRQDYDRRPSEGIHYSRIAGDTSIPYGAIYFRDTSTLRDRSYEVLGLEPRLTQRFDTAGVRHTLEAGARVLAESARRTQSRGDSTLATAGSAESDEAHGTLALAAYIHDSIAFRDGLLVIPGVRVEHVRSHRDIRRAVIAGGARDAPPAQGDGRSDLTAVIPGLGMVVGSPQIHAFGGLHVGFAPPRVVTAIRPDGIDEELNEEKSINYELGARAAPRRWIRLELAGFLVNFRDQVVPQARADSATTDLVNAGKTRHLGVESAAMLGLGEALRLGVTIDLAAQYTFSRATFEEGPPSGNLLPYAPLHTVTATLDVEHPLGFGGQLAQTYIGPAFADEANTIAADATGRVGRIEGHYVLDAGVRYRHARTGIAVSITGKNLLDRPYIASRRPDGIFPAGFRQINAGVRWDYGW